MTLLRRFASSLFFVLVQVVGVVLVATAGYLLGIAGVLGTAVVVLVSTVLLRRRSARKHALARQARRAKSGEPAVVPEPLRWRPKFSLGAIISGLIGAVAANVVLMMYGVGLGEQNMRLRMAVIAILAGVVVPSAAWAFTVRRYNARLGVSVPKRAAGIGAAMVWVFLVLGGGMGWDVAHPSAAHAEARGCNFIMNGKSAADMSGPSDALVLQPGDSVNWQFTGNEPSTRYLWQWKYNGVEVLATKNPRHFRVLGTPWWPIPGKGAETTRERSGSSDSSDSSDDGPPWAGLWEWKLTSSSCSYSFWIRTGGSPLDSPVGAAVVGVLVAATAGVAASAAGQAAGTLAGLDGLQPGPPPPPSPAPGPDSGSPTTKTVTFEGDAARDVLERIRAEGGDAVVGLTGDDQWTTTVSSETSTAREGFLGTHGRVTGTPMVVETDDGNIAVTVDVQPLTPTSPSDPNGVPAGATNGSLPEEPASPEPQETPEQPEPTPPEPSESPDPIESPGTATTGQPEPGEPFRDPSVLVDVPNSDHLGPVLDQYGEMIDAAYPGLSTDDSHHVEPDPPSLRDLFRGPGTFRADLGPVLDDLEPLLSGGSSDVTISQEHVDLAEIPRVESVTLDDGRVRVRADVGPAWGMPGLGDVDIDLKPSITANGGLALEVDGSLPAGLDETVNERIKANLDGINSKLESERLTVTSFEVTPEEITIITRPR